MDNNELITKVGENILYYHIIFGGGDKFIGKILPVKANDMIMKPRLECKGEKI